MDPDLKLTKKPARYSLEHLGDGSIPRLVEDEAAVQCRHAICIIALSTDGNPITFVIPKTDSKVDFHTSAAFLWDWISGGWVRESEKSTRIL